MNTIKVHQVAVRDIVEFVMRSGSIHAVTLSANKMSDGIKAHQAFQKKEAEIGNYESEVPISYCYVQDSIHYQISGRIDGIISNETDIGRTVIIDEIKSTGKNLDEIEQGSELHFAQAMMYAFMYCDFYQIQIVSVRLTYLELDTEKMKQFYRHLTLEELKIFFDELMIRYHRFTSQIVSTEEEIFISCRALQFPFGSPREGQGQLMKGVYRTIIEKQMLFSRAPTGIGKTIATLFPAIKALGEGKTEKIFYLTAKTIGKEVAVDTLNRLVQKGLRLKYVVITAKDKICPHDVSRCNPENCPYAIGHYDRVNEVLYGMYQEESSYTREVILRYSLIHQVCPYELSLDLALFAQVIICDYNYVFDPSAMLRRFFVEGEGKYSLLIDEAHNLVDRGREMYSANLVKDKILDLKKKTKGFDEKLYEYFNQLNKQFLSFHKEMKLEAKKERVDIEAPNLLVTYLKGVIFRIEKIFSLKKDWTYMNELVDFYFEAYQFVKKWEMYGDNYRTLYSGSGQSLVVKLFCIDPRRHMTEVLASMQGTVFFSATLIPMKYYQHLFGGDEKSYGLNLASPFEQKKMKLLVDSGISTKYMDREHSIEQIVTRIATFVHGKRGNYLVYFPSYQYLEQGVSAFREWIMRETKMEHHHSSGIDIITQERNLSEEERERFITAFQNPCQDRTLVAFAVLGGMFGEGIDLVGEKLSGAVIVGVGLPLICFERDVIKTYFDERLGEGFDYAYTYPGMNKVLQAVGRVIRTVDDVGCVLLIDSRFRTRKYQSLFPREWNHGEMIRTDEELFVKIEEFWKKYKR